MGSAAASALSRRLNRALGGEERTRVIIVLAAVLGLSGADAATVGASASELRAGLHISNTDIGLPGAGVPACLAILAADLDGADDLDLGIDLVLGAARCMRGSLAVGRPLRWTPPGRRLIVTTVRRS